jgi:hypothetical protein
MTEIFRRVVLAKSTDGQTREVIIYRMSTIAPPFVPEVCISYMGTEQSTVVFEMASLLEMVNAMVDAGKVQE